MVVIISLKKVLLVMIFLDDWIREVGESDEAVVSHEVDSYLADPLALVFKDIFFHILMWWKLIGPKYPVLAAIAHRCPFNSNFHSGI